jgi:hypothetical protein
MSVLVEIASDVFQNLWLTVELHQMGRFRVHDLALSRACGLSYCSPQPPAKAVPENHGSHRSESAPLLIMTDAWFR